MGQRYSYAQQRCLSASGCVMQRTGMLWPGCRIGVAVSGGIDSFVLLKAMRLRQKIVPFSFELMALHLNPGFAPANHAPLLPWLAREGIAAHIEVTDFGPVAHSSQNRRRSACFRCAWMRRKRLFELCRQYNLTHLAFGHNAEDLTTTFFLNLCRNGRVEGMHLHEIFFKGSLRVIRPLLTVEKKYLKVAARQWKLPVFANPCPSVGNTARSQMALGIKNLTAISHDAMRCVTNGLIRWQMSLETTGEQINVVRHVERQLSQKE